MTPKQPSDSYLRSRALDPTRSFLVQAPAGSGKTELLTDRILALLATVERPEEVVAITFTKKAAAEMHARVLEKLRTAHEPMPAEAYRVKSWELARAALARDTEMGWELLAYPARLSIRTIDALCAHLVRAMPWVSGLGGVPAVVEDARPHYLQAAMDTLALADEYEEVAQLLAHVDVHLATAQELIAQMLASRDQWQPILGNAENIVQIEHNLEGIVESELNTLLADMPLGWANDLAPLLRLAADECQRQTGPGVPEIQALLDWDGTPFEASTDYLPMWQALSHALLTGEGSLRKRITVKQGFPAKTPQKLAIEAWLNAVNDDDKWVAALARTRHLPEGYDVQQLDVLISFIKVLWIASAQLRLRFAEHGEVDFIEISQRALEALGRVDDPSELLLKVDRSMRHLLVDEFQDTSQTQIELLERLSSGWEVGDGRTLFLVGDPMQSIYRFRKAEVGLFLQVKDQQRLGEVELEPLALTNNFRSQAALVDWVNGAGAHLFPTYDDSDLGAVSYNRSEAFQANAEYEAFSFHPICSPLSDDLSDEQKQQHVVLSSQAKVVQLCKEALERYAHSKHPVAILVRARSHLRSVVRELGLRNIACRAVELEPLEARPAVQDLLQLIRALSHQGDRLAWLSVLRSPLVGLRLQSLHQLCVGNDNRSIPYLLRQRLESTGFDDLELEDARRLQLASQFLLDTRNRSGMLPFAAWVERVWQNLGGKQAYAHPGDLADAERVLRLLEETAAYGGLVVSEFERKIEALYAAPRSAGQAVEVMTIHKAKGLEFESVILYGLERRPMHDQAPLIRLEQANGKLLLGPVKPRAADEHDPVSRFLASRDKQRADFEMNRLLYVALTRARTQLHIVSEMQLKAEDELKVPTAGSLLGRLWPCIQVPKLKHTPVKVLEQAGTGLRHLKRVTTMPTQSVHWHWPNLTQNEWHWPESTTHESIMGVVAHAWLERLGKEGVAEWSAARLEAHRAAMTKQLLRAGVAATELNQAVSDLLHALKATLESERGRWLLGVARAYREWSLLDITGRVSIIDLAISQDDHWLVVDYKTSAPFAEESLDDFTERMKKRYAEQMQRYSEQVHALDGREAKAALYFPRVEVWIEYDGLTAARPVTSALVFEQTSLF